MGKYEQKNLQKEQKNQQQRSLEEGNHGSSSGFFCESRSMVFSWILREFSLRCVVVLILTLAVFLSGIFWIIPFPWKSGYDAKSATKHGASVQAYFQLQKPVTELIPYIKQLEHDISCEISVPSTKVSVLSMHPLNASNSTEVVFGVLPDPPNVPITLAILSILRSSLIELFFRQSNLTLTTSVFGQPSAFQILKFPGGVSVFPSQSVNIWEMREILFSFMLKNSISDIVENFVKLKNQLTLGLHLHDYENLQLIVINDVGSTIWPPVKVNVSIMSDLGTISPQRLKQLSEIINEYKSKNLGLDNHVFGKVKSIILASGFIKNVPSPTPSPGPSLGPSLGPSPSPTPSPGPSPEPSISPYLTPSPLYSPAPSPSNDCAPPSDHGCQYPAPNPCPNDQPTTPPSSAPNWGSNLPPPELSPSPQISHGSRMGKGSPSPAPSPLADSLLSKAGISSMMGRLLGYVGFLTFLLL